MIVGCYTLALYCAVDECPTNTFGSRWKPVEFTGPTGRGCKAQARRDGWVFCNDDVLCPTHARQMKPGRKAKP